TDHPQISTAHLGEPYNNFYSSLDPLSRAHLGELHTDHGYQDMFSTDHESGDDARTDRAVARARDERRPAAALDPNVSAARLAARAAAEPRRTRTGRDCPILPPPPPESFRRLMAEPAPEYEDVRPSWGFPALPDD